MSENLHMYMKKLYDNNSEEDDKHIQGSSKRGREPARNCKDYKEASNRSASICSIVCGDIVPGLYLQDDGCDWGVGVGADLTQR